MNDKDDLRDNLMDALLRDDAQGGTDEELLEELEARISEEESGAEGTSATTRRRQSALVPLAWAALLLVSAVFILGYSLTCSRLRTIQAHIDGHGDLNGG